MNNVPVVSRGKDRCTLVIHPDDAAALDVDARDHGAVTSGESRIVVPVELTPHIKRGVVSMPHGWGHDRPGAQLNVARSNPGVNSNRVNPSELLDLPSGNAVVNGVPVTRSAEHTSELQYLMRISYAVFCWTKTCHQKTTFIS